MLSRFTVNVDLFRVGPEGADQEQWFHKLLTTLDAWQPSAVVAMNNLYGYDPNNRGVILRERLKRWGGILIYRHYETVEHELWRKRSPDDHLKMLKSLGADDVWYQVGNEPAIANPSDRDLCLRWNENLIEVNDRPEFRLKLVLPNCGAMASQFDGVDEGAWDRLALPLAKRANDRENGFSRLMLGVHAYAHALVPWGNRDPNDLIVRENIQPDRWPPPSETFDDDPSNNWLLFGEQRLVRRILRLQREVLGWTELMPPDIAVTETNLDRMPNIETHWPGVVAKIDELAGQQVHGYPTLKRYWKWAFPQWTPAESYAHQCKWQDQAPAYYRIFAIFAWNFEEPPSGANDWRRYHNIAEDDDFLVIWPTFLVPEPPPPPPPPEPEPEPEPPPAQPAFNLTHWLLGGLFLVILAAMGLWIYSNFYFLRGLEASMPSVLTPNEAAQMLLGMLYSIFAAGGTAVGATPLTNLFKTALMLPVLNRTFHIGSAELTLAFGKIPANHIAFGVASGFTVAAWIAYQTSTQPTLNSLSDYIVQFAPFLTQLLATLGGQKALYTVSRRAELPLFGTRRS